MGEVKIRWREVLKTASMRQRTLCPWDGGTMRSCDCQAAMTPA
ncbi:MAG: hypothetical protein ABID54_00320 [Pseudomonadota bacterium]